MSLPRFLFLAVVFGGLLWFVVLPSLEEPEIHQPAQKRGEVSTKDDGHLDPWTKEEQAVWREQVNHRLIGR